MVELDRSTKTNPWKVAMIAIGGLALVIGAAAVVVAELNEADANVASASSERPPAQTIEDCNQYAANAQRNVGEIAKDGVIGGAVGAGVGAAGGAIADGGDGAGKGAGIGAIVGATAGTLYGLNEENRRTEAARQAYSDCMERKGYEG